MPLLRSWDGRIDNLGHCDCNPDCRAGADGAARRPYHPSVCPARFDIAGHADLPNAAQPIVNGEEMDSGAVQ